MTFSLRDAHHTLDRARRHGTPHVHPRTVATSPDLAGGKRPLAADSTCTDAIDKRGFSFVNGEPAILSIASPFWLVNNAGKHPGDWAAKYTGLVGWKSAAKKTIVVGHADVERLRRATAAVQKTLRWEPYEKLRSNPRKHAKELAYLLVYLPKGNYSKAAKRACCATQPKSDARIGHECDPSWCPFSDACASHMVDECSGLAADGKMPRVLDPNSPCFQWCLKNPALCDAAKMNFCRAHPDSKACSCIYRTRDPDYKATIGRLRRLGVRVPAQETCWVAQCADPTSQLIVSSEAPNTCNTSVSVCRNVLSVDDGAHVVIGNASFSSACQAKATALVRQKAVAAERETRVNADKARDAELASQRAAAEKRAAEKRKDAKSTHPPKSTVARETAEPDPVSMQNNKDTASTVSAKRRNSNETFFIALAGVAVAVVALRS